MFTLKQIEGALVEKKWPSKSFSGDYDDGYISGHNYAIDAQSSVKLRFSRVKLSLLLMEAIARYKDFEPMYVYPGTKFEMMADFLIAADKDIVEVEK